MKRLPDRTLPTASLADMASLQATVDGEPTFDAQVARAKVLFAARNRPADPLFAIVRAALDEMCFGARRCGYCEDSAADEVEHIRPKTHYPQSAFHWGNYLYACGPCNGGKSSNYAIRDTLTGRVIYLRRPPRTALLPPPDGSPLLLDPRGEEPLDVLELDLVDTFLFKPRATADPLEQERAAFTIAVLKLNSRDFLPKARREAFRSFRARLCEYRERRNGGAPAQDLAPLARAVRASAHPSVWFEMKRQRGFHAELASLFLDVPEALTW